MVTQISEPTVTEANFTLNVAAKNYRSDQGFFVAMAIAVSILIVVGFMQLALRGITDPIGAPIRVHVHALLLITWLGMFTTQNLIAHRGNIALHRKLGWASVLIVAAIVVANFYTFIMTIAEGRVGPQFTIPYFFSLGTVDTLTFAGMVIWAVALKGNTQWHRRLMFGATMIIAAAALNRLMTLVPLTGPVVEVIVVVLQTAIVGIVALHDKKILGHVHIATIWISTIIVLQHILPHAMSGITLIADFANSFA